MNVPIRPAGREDYEACCLLWKQVDGLHSGALPHMFQQPLTTPREREYWDALITDAQVGLFIAQVDQYVAGLVKVRLEDAPQLPIFVPRRYAIIDSIVVSDAHRRNGIGRKLMDAAEQWAVARRADEIKLHVYEFNTDAITFYNVIGYGTRSRTMSKALPHPDPS